MILRDRAFRFSVDHAADPFAHPRLHSGCAGTCNATKYCACSYKSELTGAEVEALNREYCEDSTKSSAEQHRTGLNHTHLPIPPVFEIFREAGRPHTEITLICGCSPAEGTVAAFDFAGTSARSRWQLYGRF